MSGEMFENDLNAYGMLSHGESNAFADIHNALDHHCQKHLGSHGIVSIGMGKLPGEYQEAFRLRFADELEAFNYDAQHRRPNAAPAEITVNAQGQFTINVGQPRMEFLLPQCGANASLVAKALEQYKRCAGRR